MTEVVIRHGEDGFIVRHVADDTWHIRKSGKLACPLAAVACDDLIAAILTGTHQRGLIDACRLDRLHKPLHLRIIPDTKGMIFERVQIRQVEINDLLFFGTGCVTGRRRLRRDLRASGSAAFIHGRLLRDGLALGLFVPRFGRLCLIGSGLAILGRSASAGFGGLVLFRGRLLFERLFLLLSHLVTGGGKIHHLASRGGVGIVLAGAGGLLIVFVRLGLFRDGHAGRLRRIWDSLAHFKEGSLPLMLQNKLFLYGQLLRPQRGGSGGVGQIGSGAGPLWGLCGSAHIGADGLFIVCHLKNLLCCEMKKASPMAGRR